MSCGAAHCGADHDVYAFHPGVCRAGNRNGLWTVRHDALQLMLVYVVRLLGYHGKTHPRGPGTVSRWALAVAVSYTASFALFSKKVD